MLTDPAVTVSTNSAAVATADPASTEAVRSGERVSSPAPGELRSEPEVVRPRRATDVVMGSARRTLRHLAEEDELVVGKGVGVQDRDEVG